jgi:hypothetical protein
MLFYFIFPTCSRGCRVFSATIQKIIKNIVSRKYTKVTEVAHFVGHSSQHLIIQGLIEPLAPSLTLVRALRRGRRLS